MATVGTVEFDVVLNLPDFEKEIKKDLKSLKKLCVPIAFCDIDKQVKNLKKELNGVIVPLDIDNTLIDKSVESLQSKLSKIEISPVISDAAIKRIESQFNKITINSTSSTQAKSSSAQGFGSVFSGLGGILSSVSSVVIDVIQTVDAFKNIFDKTGEKQLKELQEIRTLLQRNRSGAGGGFFEGIRTGIGEAIGTAIANFARNNLKNLFNFNQASKPSRGGSNARGGELVVVQDDFVTAVERVIRLTRQGDRRGEPGDGISRPLLLPPSPDAGVKTEDLQDSIKRSIVANSSTLAGSDTLSKVATDLDQFAVKLREIFTASGLKQISQGLGYKPPRDRQKLLPLSQDIASQFSPSEVTQISTKLGDQVRRVGKKEGLPDLRPEIKNTEIITDYLKEAGRNLREKRRLFDTGIESLQEQILSDVENLTKGIDSLITEFQSEGKFRQKLGGYRTQIAKTAKGIQPPSSLSDKGFNTLSQLQQRLAKELQFQGNISTPSVVPLTAEQLKSGLSGTFDPGKNQLKLKPEQIKILNEGLESLADSNQQQALEELSAILHELTHSFQYQSGDLDEFGIDLNYADITSSISAPAIETLNQGLQDFVREGVAKSTDFAVKQYAEQLKGQTIQGKSGTEALPRIEKSIAKLEEEAYISGLKVAEDIISEIQQPQINTPEKASFSPRTPAVDNFFGEFNVEPVIAAFTKPNNKDELKNVLQSQFQKAARTPQQRIADFRDQSLEALVDEVELRAREIEQSLPNNLDAEQIIFAVGGFAGQQGKSSNRVAAQVQKAFTEALVVPVENKLFDVTTDAQENIGGWMAEIISDKVFATNLVEGAIPDTKELTAQMLAYARKYDISPNAVGFSGGGFVVEEALQLLEKFDRKGAGVGIGTPRTGFSRQNPNFTSFGASDDPLFTPFRLSQDFFGVGDQSRQSKGIGKGHALENYTQDLELIAKIQAHFNGEVLESEKRVSGFEKASAKVQSTVQDLSDGLSSVGVTARQSFDSATDALDELQRKIKEIETRRKQVAENFSQKTTPPPPSEGVGIEGFSTPNLLRGGDDNVINVGYSVESIEPQKLLPGTGDEFDQASASVNSFLQNIRVMFKAFRDADSTIGNFLDLVVDTKDGLLQASPQAEAATDSFFGFRKALLGINIAIGVVGALKTLADFSLEASNRMQVLRSTTEFLAGSQQNYVKTLSFINSEVKRNNALLEPAIKGFNNLAASTRGTALEGTVTQELFSSLAQAQQVFGLTGEEFEGSILAISQIAGKGVVSMEELRGQLAERIPGAFQIAARAMGVTEQELSQLVASGNLVATDFLPKFARQLSLETKGGIVGSSNLAQSAINNFENSILNLKTETGDIFRPVQIRLLNLFSGGMDLLAKNSKVVVGLLSALGLATLPLIVKGTVAAIAAGLKIVGVDLAVKGLAGSFLLVKNVIQRAVLPTLLSIGKTTLIFFAATAAIAAMYKVYQAFAGEVSQDQITKTLNSALLDSKRKAEDLRAELAKLKGEALAGEPTNLPQSNFEAYLEEQERLQKAAIETGNIFNIIGTDIGGVFKGVQARLNDVSETRNLEKLKIDINEGALSEVFTQADQAIAESESVISRGKALSDEIGRLSVQAKDATGAERFALLEEIELKQKELQSTSFLPEQSLGNVTLALQQYEKELDGAFNPERRKVLKGIIEELTAKKRALESVNQEIGPSSPLGQFSQSIRQIQTDLTTATREAEEFQTKGMTQITKDLRTNSLSDYFAEGVSELSRTGIELEAVENRLTASQEQAQKLSTLLAGSSGEIGALVGQFEGLSLEQLQTELDLTDDKDEARKRTLSALIQLRESEREILNQQQTQQELLLRQEQQRAALAQERLQRELEILRADSEISQAESRLPVIQQQIQGGVSSNEIAQQEAALQLEAVNEAERIRQKELAGIESLQRQGLITARQYEDQMRALKVQGAQNRLQIAEAELQAELAKREAAVAEIDRKLQQTKVSYERQDVRGGFAVERLGQQQNVISIESTTASTLNEAELERLNFQKQLAERARDLSGIESTNSQIYQQQLQSLSQENEFKRQSLELTSQQQQLQLNLEESRSRLAVIEASAEVEKLKASKATAEEISIAEQNLAISQEQLNFTQEKQGFLETNKQLELEGLKATEQANAEKLEQARRLELITEAEGRITADLELQKSRSEALNQSLEQRQKQLSIESSISQLNSEAREAQLNHELRLAETANNLQVAEQIKARLYQEQSKNIQASLGFKQQELELATQQEQIAAQTAILDAEANLAQLNLNNVSGEQLQIANQQLQLAQQKLGYIQENFNAQLQQNQLEATNNQLALDREYALQKQADLVNIINQSLEKQRQLVELTTSENQLQIDALQSAEQYNQAITSLNSTQSQNKQEALEADLRQAEAAQKIGAIEQIKSQIYKTQLADLKAQMAASQQSLDIAHQQQELEYENKAIQSEFAVEEAKANLEQLKVNNATVEQLQLAQRMISLRERQRGAIEQQKGTLNQIQSIERERLQVEQQGKEATLERNRQLDLQAQKVARINAEMERVNQTAKNQETQINLAKNALSIQSDFLSSQGGLQEALAAEAQAGINLDIKKAESRGDTDEVERLKVEAYGKQIEALLQAQEIEAENLKIKQQQIELELYLAKVKQRQAISDAQANIERRKAEGASAAEIAQLQTALGYEREALGVLEAKSAFQDEINRMDAERVASDQRTARLNLEAQGVATPDSEGNISDLQRRMERESAALRNAPLFDPTQADLTTPPTAVTEAASRDNLLQTALDTLNQAITNGQLNKVENLTVVSNNPTQDSAAIINDLAQAYR